MGHYDYDTSGPSRYELRQRRDAYESKQDAIAREKICDEHIREFLYKLNECRSGDGLSCGRESYCSAERHAKECWFDESVFESARKIVSSGGSENVYFVLDTTREVSQIVSLCRDAGLITMGFEGDTLTDKGHKVMLGDGFERPEITWDEQKAEKYKNSNDENE